ncbi:MFS transporter [Brasilonema octagenarum UFV-E1]|uniref:MFS transporter n=2 Tax=Bromeliae group (in: Brasilonema) TaxID=3398495 RepID=A0A856MGC7_9CYAN|nr:MFS transporter [Brasilonema sennae]QDL08137.1 MFS transporter [Brasilonema sennae CENA114]QDL14496.1 MFS transporter [Brasilonema octagenarum UFV-E1]
MSGTINIQLQSKLLILFAAGLLFWSSIGSLLPTLPLYVESVGATKQQIGIVMGSFAIGLLFFRPLLGRLADWRGRKIVLLIGTLVAAIAPLGYLLVKSIPLLIVVRAFHGISLAAFTTGFNALVADIAPSQKRGEIIGYMSLVNPIGVAIGPALGGYLQAGVGDQILFLMTAELAFVAFLGLLTIVNPPLPTHQQGSIQNLQFWQVLFSPRVRIPAFIMLLVGLAFGALHVFVPLFIKSTGINLNPGLFYTAAAVASFAIRIFTAKASDRFGRGLFITISLVLYTLALSVLWLAKSPATFLFASMIEGIASGTLIPIIAVLMVDRAHPYERGQIFAICLMGLDIGIAIAGPILGYVAEYLGYRNMFGLCASLTFLGLIVFLTFSGKDLSSSVRFALGRGRDVYALKDT